VSSARRFYALRLTPLRQALRADDLRLKPPVQGREIMWKLNFVGQFLLLIFIGKR